MVHYNWTGSGTHFWNYTNKNMTIKWGKKQINYHIQKKFLASHNKHGRAKHFQNILVHHYNITKLLAVKDLHLSCIVPPSQQQSFSLQFFFKLSYLHLKFFRPLGTTPLLALNSHAISTQPFSFFFQLTESVFLDSITPENFFYNF